MIVAVAAAAAAAAPRAARAVVRWETSGGAVVMLEPSATLPLVDFSIVLRTGSTLDPRGKDGLTGLAELRREFPNLCVTMFSGLDDRELVFEALRLGAMGFIVKSVSRQAFVEALRDVLSGRVYLPPSVVGPQADL